MVNGLNEVGDGAIKTFPLRCIKDSAPLHARRAPADARRRSSSFNLIIGTKLTTEQKHNLVAFLRIH